jgi:division protein CdvB (Snf7/Vps24/ESCRT-III family)
MTFCTLNRQKTAAELVARLSTIERIIIRAAETSDRLEYLRQVDFRTDNVSEADMLEVKRIVDEQFRIRSAELVF